MTFETLPGVGYCVTARTDATVTDGNGMSLTVEAGAQAVFVASTAGVEYDPTACTIVQVRGNFSMPPADGSGGGQIAIDPAPTQGSENAVSSGGVYTALRELPAPTPEPLGTTTTLLHGHVYTLEVSADTDLSALGVELYGTAELWIDYTAGSVTWPQLWSWVDGIVPTFTAGNRYFMRVWSDGVAVIAKLEYSYTNV